MDQDELTEALRQQVERTADYDRRLAAINDLHCLDSETGVCHECLRAFPCPTRQMVAGVLPD